MEKSVPFSTLTRLLRDSKESTLTTLDELCFLRHVIYCLSNGISYEDALQHTYGQLNDLNQE